MGGRLDATNVLDAGVAAITNVQLDHERYLGRTLAAIGTEKAAIIKPGNLAVTGAHRSRPAAHPRPLRCRWRAAAAAPGRGSRIARRCARPAGTGCVVDAAHARRRAARRSGSGCSGSHQAATRRSRSALLDALARGRRAARRAARPITRGDPSRACATARWPGRLELLARDAHSATGPARRRPQPGRRARPRRGPRRAGRAPLPARLRRDARQAGPRRAARPRPAGARAPSSPRSTIPARAAAGELLRRVAAHRRRRGRAVARRPRQALSQAAGAAPPPTSRSWWPARSTWSARCVACSPDEEEADDRAALGRADVGDGHHQRHARLVLRRRPRARRTREVDEVVARGRGAGTRVRRGRRARSSTSAPSRRGRRTAYGEHPAGRRRATRPPSRSRSWPRWRAAFGDRALVSIDTIKGRWRAQALAAGATHRQRRVGRAARPGHGRRRRRGGRAPGADAQQGGGRVPRRRLRRGGRAGSRRRSTTPLRRGVARDRLIVDPGIGFGKTPEHSIELLHRLGRAEGRARRPAAAGRHQPQAIHRRAARRRAAGPAARGDGRHRRPGHRRRRGHGAGPRRGARSRAPCASPTASCGGDR